MSGFDIEALGIDIEAFLDFQYRGLLIIYKLWCLPDSPIKYPGIIFNLCFDGASNIIQKKSRWRNISDIAG